MVLRVALCARDKRVEVIQANSTSESARRMTASAPGGIGNIGPALDVLGCAVAGLRDEVTAEWYGTPGVSLLDAGHPELPTDPARHTSAIAATADAALPPCPPESGSPLRHHSVSPRFDSPARRNTAAAASAAV